LENPKGVSKSDSMNQSLSHRGHEFLVFAQKDSILIDENLSIKHGPRSPGKLFTYPHDDPHFCAGSGLAQSVRSWTGNLHGIFKKLCRQSQTFPAGRWLKMIPHRMGGNETFREGQERNTSLACLTNKMNRFLNGGISVEKNWGSLQDPDSYLSVAVTHGMIPPWQDRLRLQGSMFGNGNVFPNLLFSFCTVKNYSMFGISLGMDLRNPP
jgi:hypothetical protein